ncbi:hypothetical protein M5D96_014119 [Drosophila gunungcola]|uniref:Uncharacterized protein n=1 Tax=Drosophila gunungcola TaxID=103775 RepID=A0A9P9YAS8_9MUSC|nr:hypothetical protein M5D96_014119 [Drosophila gunungcola]
MRGGFANLRSGGSICTSGAETKVYTNKFNDYFLRQCPGEKRRQNTKTSDKGMKVLSPTKAINRTQPKSYQFRRPKEI